MAFTDFEVVAAGRAHGARRHAVGEAGECVRRGIQDMGGSVGLVAADNRGIIPTPYRGHTQADGKTAV